MGTKFEVTNTGLVKFKQNGTEQFVFENGAVTPVSGVEGQSFYRTDTDQLLVHDGVDFKAVLGGSFRIWGETPNETPDGIVTAFTVDNPYVAGTTMVTRDGLVMKLGDDYTESAPQSGQITFSVAPSNGSIILIAYSRVEGSALPIMQKFDIVIGTPKQTYSGSTTVVDLPFAYTPASGSLFVYSAGILMLVGGSNDYVETDNNTITFNTARTVSEVIQFIKIGAANDQSTSGWVDAGSVVQLQSAGDQVQIGDGGVSAPGLSFIGDSNTGIWHSSGDTMNFVTGGTNRWQMDSGGALLQASGNTTGRFLLLDGTSALPAFAFANDTDTGIYRQNPDILGFVTGGVARWVVTAAGDFGVQGTHKLLIADGTAASPGLQFNNDSNTGIYLSGTDQIALSSNGTQTLMTDGTFVYSRQPHLFVDGSPSSPALAFSSDNDTGLYFVGSRIAFSVNNSLRMRLGADGLILDAGQFLCNDGTSAAPSYTWGSDDNTGFYRRGENSIGLSGGGVEIGRIEGSGIAAQTTTIRLTNPDNTSGNSNSRLYVDVGGASSGDPFILFQVPAVTSWSLGLDNSDGDSFILAQASTLDGSNNRFKVITGGQAQFVDGTAGAPSLSFLSDPDLGIYKSSSDVLGISAGGTTSLLISQTGITYSIAQEWEIRSISSNDSMATTDHVVLVDATSGAVTYSLATASGKDGRVLIIKKTDSSVNNVVVDPSGSETIDGNSTHTLTTQYEAVTLVAHGNNWHII